MTEEQVDQIIEQTLVRDADRIRRTFATVPNEQLTAKLALSTASKGLLASLGSKLALYGGAALVVGAAVYFAPRANTSSPTLPTTSVPAPATVHVQSSSSVATGLPAQPESKPSASATANPMRLDENSTPIERRTESGYHPPIK
jgi:hypothetical protein